MGYTIFLRLNFSLLASLELYKIAIAFYTRAMCIPTLILVSQ